MGFFGFWDPMADVLDFALKLTDDFSSPAKAGANAAVLLARQLTLVDHVSEGLAKRLAVTAGVEEGTAKKALAQVMKAEDAKVKATERSAIAQAKAQTKTQATAQKKLLEENKKSAKNASADFDKVFGDATTMSGGLIGALQKVTVGATLAIVALTAAGAGFALQQASQKQDLQLTLEALLGSADAGVVMENQLQELSKTLPISRDRVDALAISLINAGQTGDALTRTIKSLALVESTVGSEGAGKIQGIIEKWATLGKVAPLNAKQLAGTGVTIDALNKIIATKLGTTVANVENLIKAGKVSVQTGVDALNEAIEGKLGNVAAKKLLGLGAQAEKAKEAIGNLFEDSLGPGGLESFEKGLADILGLFDDATGSGQTLKFLLGAIFTPLFQAITDGLPFLKAFFVGMEIGALRIYLAIRPVIQKLQEIFGSDKESTLADTMVNVGIAVVYAAGAIAGLIALAVGGVASIVGAFVSFYNSVQNVWNGLTVLMDWLRGLDFISIGAGLVDGFIAGIQSRVSGVVDSVKGLGTSALRALGITLDAHSPSRKAMALGRFTGEGYAMGVDAENDNARSSLAGLGQLPDPQTGGGGRGGGAITLTLNLTLPVGVSKADAEEIGNAVLAKVAGAFESLGVQTGAPVSEVQAA